MICYSPPCLWVYLDDSARWNDSANLGEMLLRETIPLYYVISLWFMKSLRTWKSRIGELLDLSSVFSTGEDSRPLCTLFVRYLNQSMADTPFLLARHLARPSRCCWLVFPCSVEAHLDYLLQKLKESENGDLFFPHAFKGVFALLCLLQASRSNKRQQCRHMLCCQAR